MENLLKKERAVEYPQEDHSNEKKGFYAGILFLVWPLLALISAFSNYRSSWGKNILWAFVAFYGFSYAIGVESQNTDIVRYIAEVKQLHGTEMSIGDALRYYQNSGEIDVLRTFIAVVVSRFTDSAAFLTLLYGIIFGFFFSRNIWYVLNHLKGKLSFPTILLLSCLFLVIPFWSITTFRMWTAAHIFLYGLLPFLFEGKNNRILFCFVSALVHFSFIVPIGVLSAYFLLGNRLILYFGFFLLTFFISEINIEAFNNLVENYAPEMLQERTEGYRSTAYVEEYRQSPEDSVWYAVWYGRALKWTILGFLCLLFFEGKNFFAKHRRWLNLFSFTLLFFGVANLLNSLPSGGRFLDLAEYLALALIILYFQNQNHTALTPFARATVPVLLFYIVIAFRTGLYSISATTVIGNPIIAGFISGDHISLNDVIKMIL